MGSRLRKILDAMPDMYFVVDRDGIILDFKPGRDLDSVMPPGEFLGKKLSDVMPGQIGGKGSRYITEALDSREEKLFEYSLSSKTGPQFFEARIVPLEEDEALCIVRDVTEKKLTEEELRRSHAIRQALMDASMDMAVLLDPEGKILAINEKAAESFQMSPEEMVGEILFDHLTSEVAEMRRRSMEQIMRTGLPNMTVNLSRDRVYEVSGNPLMERGEQVTAIGFFIRDITEKVKIDEAVMESEARYRRLFEENPVPMYIYNVESLKILAVNEAMVEHYGYSRKEFESMSMMNLRPPGEVDRVHSHIEDLTPGTLYTGVWKHLKKDGSLIEVDITSADFPYENRRARLVLCIDVTAQKRAQEQIRASLKEKDILLKEIHHRVKNNLQVISGLLNLQSHYIDDDSVKGIYRESQNRVISMALIHEDLYQREDLARVDFSDYIRNLTENLFASYGVARGLVALAIDVEDIRLVVDTAIPCGLIINELITNSLKHGFPKGGKGTVSITFQSDEDGTLSLILADDGVGFPEGVDFRKTKSLGLQLVTILVEQLGGTMDLDREGGTTFRIRFKEYQEAGTEMH